MELSIHDLSHKFGGRGALDQINLEFEPGLFYGIIGPNGSGKTTLLKLISDLIKAPPHSISLEGKDSSTYKEKERARKISLVPQIFSMDFAFPVEDLVAMGRYPYLTGLQELTSVDKEAVQQALLQTDLLEYVQRDANTLSGGELQRVLLARALAQSTPIMLLDEPLSHLDLHHQLNILRLIRNLCHEKKMTAICVMHDLNLTMQYCDQVIMLNKGQVFAQGETGAVLNQENIQTVYDVKVRIIEIEGQKTILFH